MPLVLPLAFVRVINRRTDSPRARVVRHRGYNVAGFNRIKSASALAALSISVSAIAQQSPAADPPKGEEVDTVVVTGVREALAKGLENKRESTQVIESIVAEDIGKLPDNNVIEALQRVPGVQVTDRGRGETTRLFIRGLPDPATTWNGRNIFTSMRPTSVAGMSCSCSWRPYRRLQDPLGGATRDRPRRPDRRAYPPSLRLRRPPGFGQCPLHLSGTARFEGSFRQRAD